MGKPKGTKNKVTKLNDTGIIAKPIDPDSVEWAQSKATKSPALIEFMRNMKVGDAVELTGVSPFTVSKCRAKVRALCKGNWWIKFSHNKKTGAIYLHKVMQ